METIICIKDFFNFFKIESVDQNLYMIRSGIKIDFFKCEHNDTKLSISLFLRTKTNNGG